MGHLDEARRRLARVEAIPGVPPTHVVHALMNSAASLRAEGRLAESATAFDAILPLRGQVAAALRVSLLINAASCFHQVGRLAEAERAMGEVHQELPDLDRPDLDVWADAIGAWIAGRAHQPVKAVDLARRALRPGREGANSSSRGSAARALAEVALWRGLPELREEAVAALERLLAEAGPGRVQREAVDLHGSLAQLHEARGDLAQAVHHLREARALEGKVAAQGEQLRLEREALRLEVVRMQVEADALRAHQVELSRANQALVSSDAARARLLATLAHDLRSPLTSVMALADLVDPEDPESVRQGLQSLVTAVHRMVAMVDAALAPQSGTTSAAVDLGQVTRAAAAGFHGVAARKDQRIAVRADQPALIRASEVSLGRLVDNLLSNALKYGPPGGLVEVEVAAAAMRIDLVVKDQGPGFPGIDPSEGLLYGHQLSTRSTGGEASWGLGLHTVYQLLADLGGILALGNRPEGGAMVRVTLPPG